MQLKEFSLIPHTIEPGTVLKALETAIPWTAIEQAIGKAKAGEERKRALPSHLVVCPDCCHELVVLSLNENSLEKPRRWFE
jgi:hypothetical protein